MFHCLLRDASRVIARTPAGRNSVGFHAMSSSARQSHGLVVLLFFLSGFSGLIYEVVWVRWLTMFVGGGAFAVSTILTAFMGGLAVGSFCAARWVDRVRQSKGLIFGYGLLEAGVGIYALLFPLLCIAFKPLYTTLYERLCGSLIAYNSASALLSIALLIVPTALMGATLPFLARFWVVSPASTGTRMGWLYGINTIGAALGALVCGFWMIRRLGVYETVFIAAGLNLAIGAFCVVWSRRMAGGGLSVVEKIEQPAEPEAVVRSASGWSGIAVLLAASGFCAMAYEVIWTRLISLLVGPTTYSFTVVLFSFITGLALGSVLFGWMCDRVRSPFRLLCATQWSAAALALVTSQFLGNSQLFFSKLLYEMREHFLLGELTKLGVLFAVMLPPTLLLGAVFPIAVKLCGDRAKSLGESVGKLYAMNTSGALLGAFAAGFLLIPALGQAMSLTLLAGAQAVICSGIFLAHRPRRTISFGFSLAAAAGVVGLAAIIPRWDAGLLVTAQYHRFENNVEVLRSISYWDALAKGASILRGRQEMTRVRSVEDGIGGFVGLTEKVNALGYTNLALRVSGKTDASSMADLDTETLLGNIPLLLHRGATNVLVIGLASGITAGEMLHYPLKRLEVLEISPEVIRACRSFTPWNNDVLSDPRAHIINQDARTHLTLSREQYDVIVSEPSNPWMAGVANLFTREFLVKARAHLKPGGVFVQWIHIYQSDWATFATIGRTIHSVFPNAILVRLNAGDLLFLCFESKEGFLDLDTASRNLPYLARSANVRMKSPEILARLVVGDDLERLFGAGPLNTDAHPVLEYLSPLRLYREGSGNIEEMLSARATYGPRVAQARQVFGTVAGQIDYAEFRASMFDSPLGIVDVSRATPAERERYQLCLAAYASAVEPDPSAFEQIRNPWERAVFLDAQEAAIRTRLARLVPDDHQALAVSYCGLGYVFALRGDSRRAIICMQQALAQVPDFQLALWNLQVACKLSGQYQAAAEVVSKLLEIGPVTPRLLVELAIETANLHQDERAVGLLNQALDLDPDYAPALVLASMRYAELGDLGRAIDYAQRAIKADPQNGLAYATLAAALSKSGKVREAREVINRGLQQVPNHPGLLNLRRQLE
jgi:spermidine synthase